MVCASEFEGLDGVLYISPIAMIRLSRWMGRPSGCGWKSGKQIPSLRCGMEMRKQALPPVAEGWQPKRSGRM